MPLEDRVALKENDVFVVSDLSGDIPAENSAGLGLYRSDTRFLSTYELRLGGQPPILLNSSVDRAYVATFQLVNPLLAGPAGDPIPRQSLSIRRTRFVHGGMHERIGIRNCNQRPVELEVELRFAADYLDIFDVRGYQRPVQRVQGAQGAQGAREPVQTRPEGLRFGYLGLDGLRRRTEVLLRPAARLGHQTATWALRLGPQETCILIVGILPVLGDGEPPPDLNFDAALRRLEATYQRWNATCTRYRSDNERLDGGIGWRNLEDLRVLCDSHPGGLFPTAGVPWYAVPFGRDALITSLQTLGLNPDLARGSLRYLARHQGTKVDPAREEEPGKILHEFRFGELARLGRIPHTPYYGTVDATPLFVVLMVETMDWTGECGLLDELWPNLVAALEWVDRRGDLDGDGFVEYAQHGSQGLRNQGWKDSGDSLVEEVGTPAPLPAALVEVQGYVYQAKSGLARILRRLGRRAEAERLGREARALRRRFNRSYWMPASRYYAQALDGDKRQVASITSNPGHCLWSGIVEPARASPLAARLMAPDMFSGWGVRTLSTEAVSYNPMSYHNGSVWPHDNSIIAAGLRRYGFRAEAERVASSVLEACMRFKDHRIPELFCGFSRDRRFNSQPGEYLVSCSPQAWGAGSLFHLLQTLAGVEAGVIERRLRIDPLPTTLYRRLRVEGMRVGEGELDFTVECADGTATVSVDRAPAGLRLELPA